MTPIKYWSFTIRAVRDTGASTELLKRLQAIRTQALLPRYTTQAFVEEPPGQGDLLGIGVVETTHLYEVVEEQIRAGVVKTNRTTNAEFVYVAFDEVESAWFDPGFGWREGRAHPTQVVPLAMERWQ